MWWDLVFIKKRPELTKKGQKLLKIIKKGLKVVKKTFLVSYTLQIFIVVNELFVHKFVHKHINKKKINESLMLFLSNTRVQF